MSANQEAFIREIVAHPDDAPRLIYADWLEERGDPQGEFIRIYIRVRDRGASAAELAPNAGLQYHVIPEACPAVA